MAGSDDEPVAGSDDEPVAGSDDEPVAGNRVATIEFAVQKSLRSIQTGDVLQAWETICATDRVLRFGTIVPIDAAMARSFLAALEYPNSIADDDPELVSACLRFVSRDRPGGVALRQVTCLTEALIELAETDDIEVHRELHSRVRRAGLKSVTYISTRTLRELDTEARRDELTLLFNRRAFDEQLDQRVEEARTADSVLSIAFLDMDGLKKVNDIQGHDAGDAYLQMFAAKLASTFSAPNDGTFRFGGDEYAVLTGSRPATVRAALTDPALATQPFSFGVSSFPSDGTTAFELVKLADDRMYEHKRSKRRSWRVRLATLFHCARTAWSSGRATA